MLVPLHWMFTLRADKPVPEVGRVSDAVCRALVLAGISHKAAALAMGIDPAEWSRQLHGRGPNLARLLMLGPSFWQHFAPLLAELHGVQPAPGSDLRSVVQEEVARALRQQTADARGSAARIAS